MYDEPLQKNVRMDPEHLHQKPVNTHLGLLIDPGMAILRELAVDSPMTFGNRILVSVLLASLISEIHRLRRTSRGVSTSTPES